MRAESKNRWEPVIQEAVKRADNNRRRATGATRSRIPATTSTGVDGDGDTTMPMIYNIDKWNDSAVYWS